jgi:hypothetical protein
MAEREAIVADRMARKVLLRVRLVAGSGLKRSEARMREIVGLIRAHNPALLEAPPELAPDREEKPARRGRGRDRQERGGLDRAE